MTSSHTTVLPGGSRRHHAWPTPPWLSTSVVPSRIGIAARNGQENGTRATPNISVTTGDITSHTSTVSTAHDTKEIRNRGLLTVADGSCGQASRSRTTSAAALASSSRTSTPVKPSQDWLNANSQRRS